MRFARVASLLTHAVVAFILFAVPPANGREMSKLQGELENTGAEPMASGKLRSVFRTGRSELRLEVKNLTPTRIYTVLVGGVPEDTFTTSATGSASLRYQTPLRSGPARLLDFDPRGKEVAIAGDAGEVLEAVTSGPAQSAGFRTDERVDLTATPVAAGAAARARFRSDRDGRKRFDIQLEKAPAGSYALFVDGVPRGAILVDATGRGKIEFSTTPENAELLLDFDPRGLIVDIVFGSQIAFSGRMTARAQGVTDCVFSEVEVQIASTGVDPDGSARARLRTRSDCEREFDVEVEDVAPGNYDLVVGGVLRGVITVVDNGFSVEGDIEFSNASDDPDEALLNFDPEGQTIEILQGATVFFAGVFDSVSGGPGSSACQPTELQLPLLNSGAVPAAKGKARFRVRDNCDQDFRVEIEDLPPGDYGLIVGGTLRATITVTDTGFGTEGEVEFDSDPNEPGELLLDFNPHNKLLEIVQAATVFLSRTFDGAAGGGAGSCTPQDTRLDLVNVGPVSQAKGDARFRVRDDCDRDFRVQIEDLPAGPYNLIVGGTLRGTITVVAGEGEIQFDTEPDDPGELLLVFDPRSQLIEIEKAGTVYLNLLFP